MKVVDLRWAFATTDGRIASINVSHIANRMASSSFSRRYKRAAIVTHACEAIPVM